MNSEWSKLHMYGDAAIYLKKYFHVMIFILLVLILLNVKETSEPTITF